MPNKNHCFRLHPGDELRTALASYCETHKIDAAVLLSCVGSCTQATLRFAGRDNNTRVIGNLEIVGATGTLSRHGMHIHLAVSDANGDVAGGHLSEGTLIRTTCEVVLLELDDVVFTREKDDATGFKELKIEQKKEL